MPALVELRRVAVDDIDAAVDHLLNEDASTARRFTDALETAIQQLREFPDSGSLQFAHIVDIPDLRVWPVPAFPYLIFYRHTSDVADVWRVLHERRDIPSTLTR